MITLPLSYFLLLIQLVQFILFGYVMYRIDNIPNKQSGNFESKDSTQNATTNKYRKFRTNRQIKKREKPDPTFSPNKNDRFASIS